MTTDNQPTLQEVRLPDFPTASLQELEALVPGGAARVLVAMEEARKHSQKMQEAALRLQWAGLIAGWLMVGAIMALAATLVLKGHDAAGATFAGVDVVGVAAVFVAGQVTSLKR